MTWFAHANSERENLSLLLSIFTHMSDAVLLADETGLICGANPAVTRMTGWTAEELVGKRQLCALCKGVDNNGGEDSCSCCFLLQESRPSFEMRLLTKDGQEIPVAASSTRLPEEGHVQTVLILRDLTEQQRMERERMQRLLTNYVIQAQEQERKRVSRDLHDGVGQALYSILVGMKVLHQLPMDETMRNHLEDIQQLTVRALDEVKNLAVELRPSALDDLGLVPALRSYMKRFEQTFGIEALLQVKGRQRRYASAVETALYRICQEAMINAAKYADDDQIQVVIDDQGQQLIMIIEDHGRGFDVDSVCAHGSGLGLYGMKERAQLLGGMVNIFSQLGKGTRIHVMIPLNEKGEPRYVDPSFDR